MILYRDFAFIAALSMINAPCVAQTTSGFRAFSQLCLDGGYTQLSSISSSSYPTAEPISDNMFLNDVVGSMPFELIEAWDLLPYVAKGEGLSLAVGLVDDTLNGPMAACIVLIEYELASNLVADLQSIGAEADAAFWFIETDDRLWMVRVNGAPVTPLGIAAIIGLTPNGPPPN